MLKITMPIDQHEAAALISVLRESLDELHAEIVRTEQWELKDSLKERVRVLERLVSRLEKRREEIKVA